MTPGKSAELLQAALVIGTRKFIGKRYLDILAFKDLLKLANTYSNWKDSKELESISALHCVDWTAMGADTEVLVKDSCLEMLGIVDKTIVIPNNPDESVPVGTGFFRWLR